MAKGKKKEPKDQFAMITEKDPNFRDTVMQSSPEEIRKIVAKIALDTDEILTAKKNDEHLKEMVEQAKEAGAGYREAKKLNDLKIKFARQTLDSKGASH